MLPALTFCEPTRVVSYYERLEDYFNSLQIITRLRQILAYFEDTYIGRFYRTERSPPLLPIDFWNQYQRCLNEQPRTNNSVEGWHNAFSSLADAPKQNIYSFLHLLKDEMTIVDNKINTLEMNPAVTPSERANFSNERLRTLVARFNELDPIEYLRNIALLLNF
ncbi:hypothetical protein RF11_04095 [Thelohanellus kitauei]|uniref:Uncharacterized protein n=1 Tax=Thelohanellus kitauei TaxID=669202 RepID=A0A0C2IK87_THEKT|nr:hypothetical protein RF11_04095 [Thelohanellus kitauei]